MQVREIFSNNLKQTRLDLGLTQAQAAELIGVEVTSYNRWENGKTQPKYDDIDRICNKFNVNVYQLYYEGKETKQKEPTLQQALAVVCKQCGFLPPKTNK